MKTAVVYWSGSGNTENMANIFASNMGAEVFTTSDFDVNADFDAYIFGCPSMGAEVLEEGEFQPMWDEVKSKLAGKKVVLFGSYGWGDGEWIRNWEEEAKELGMNVVGTLMFNYEADSEAEENCAAICNSLKA